MPEVRARLVKGQPVLQVLDADDSSVRMAWPLPTGAAATIELRELFRELFLLGTCERLNRDGRLHHTGWLPEAQD